LQYRVMKGLYKIVEAENQYEVKMKEYKPNDIIIVAHSGVNKVILSNLCNTNLSKDIMKLFPYGGISVADFTNNNMG